MAHVNLYVKVGRAEKRCIGTFEAEKRSDADTAADFAQSHAMEDLHHSGVDPVRVEFSREAVGYDAPKKGKG